MNVCFGRDLPDTNAMSTKMPKRFLRMRGRDLQLMIPVAFSLITGQSGVIRTDVVALKLALQSSLPDGAAAALRVTVSHREEGRLGILW